MSNNNLDWWKLSVFFLRILLACNKSLNCIMSIKLFEYLLRASLSERQCVYQIWICGFESTQNRKQKNWVWKIISAKAANLETLCFSFNFIPFREKKQNIRLVCSRCYNYTNLLIYAYRAMKIFWLLYFCSKKWRRKSANLSWWFDMKYL